MAQNSRRKRWGGEGYWVRVAARRFLRRLARGFSRRRPRRMSTSTPAPTAAMRMSLNPRNRSPAAAPAATGTPLAIIRTVSSPSNVDPHRAQCHPPTQRARQVRADRHREHDQEQPQVGPAKHPGQRRWVDREHQREQAQDGNDLQRVATKCARQRCHAAVSLRCVPGAPCPTRPTIKRAVDHGGRSNLIVTLSRYAMCPAAP
jgi:hypothetical protein